jgi:hypothetical protein
MERMPAGSTLLVGSDHGNGTYEYGVDLNQYFAELGLLRFDSPTRIDHENTVVFHNLWYLYFNPDLLTRDELSKRGIDVPPGEDPREYMVRYMIQVGRNLKTAERGFPVDFLPMAPEARGDTPDMAVVGSYDDYIVEFWNIMKPHSAAVGELKGGDRFWHIRDGVFLAWGDQVRRNFDAGIREAPDVAPTILYRLGLPVGADMDGQAMLDVFDPALVESLPLLVNERYTDIPKKTILDKDERESLRKKLRSLGYVQ